MENKLIDLILFLFAGSLLGLWPVLAASEAGDNITGRKAVSIECANPSGVSGSGMPGFSQISVASMAAPDDEYFNKQWALTKPQAPDAWWVPSGSQEVLVAVLDTGIDQTHEDLPDKVAASVNFSDSPTTSDFHGHGTHVAGIIAAAANNGIGIAGVAPNSHLLNVKVTDDSGMVCPSKIAEGIVWAADNGANVINMSFSLSVPPQAVEDAVDYAWSEGVVVVSAAGNYVGDNPIYPAYYSDCIAVTAADADGSPVSWANHGSWVDVAAPGTSIYSTLPGNGYGYKSGTSMAAAHVAGVAGLLFSVVCDTNDNGLLNDEVRYMIENTCHKLGIIGVGKACANAQEGCDMSWRALLVEPNARRHSAKSLTGLQMGNSAEKNGITMRGEGGVR